MRAANTVIAFMRYWLKDLLQQFLAVCLGSICAGNAVDADGSLG